MDTRLVADILLLVATFANLIGAALNLHTWVTTGRKRSMVYMIWHLFVLVALAFATTVFYAGRVKAVVPPRIIEPTTTVKPRALS